MTPREKLLLDADRDENERNRLHSIKLRQMDIDAKKTELKLRQLDRIRNERNQLKLASIELETRRYQARWTNILSLPRTFILLPVYIIFGIAYCIGVLTKQELPDRFWNFIKQ